MIRHKARHTAAILRTCLLVCVVAVAAGACATPPTSPESVPEPTVAPTDAAASKAMATDGPQATLPPTDEPSTPTPTEPQPTPPPSAVPPTDTPSPTPPPAAQYELIFEATWSAVSHPTDFPANPHFSPLIGATHGPDAALWTLGGQSSPGIKNMAETGSTSPLDSEIDALIGDGTACAAISGNGVPVSPGSTRVTFTVTLDCPLVTVVTMIAPSPDWFVGVSGLSLLREGAWVEGLTVELLPYDAGTDSGPSYASPNAPTGDPRGVYLIDGEPLLIDGAVTSLGTFAFTLLSR